MTYILGGSNFRQFQTHQITKKRHADMPPPELKHEAVHGDGQALPWSGEGIVVSVIHLGKL